MYIVYLQETEHSDEVSYWYSGGTWLDQSRSAGRGSHST